SSSSSQTPAAKPPLPPGMVMGPDGKPCKICTAFRNWKPPTKQSSGSDSSRKGKGQFGGIAATMAALAAGTTAAAAASTTSTTTRPNEPPPNCPPDVEQLGRATWTFLHTTAAYYPEKPTPNQRANMLALLGSLPVLYPCGWCAKDFGEDIARHPPDVSSRVGLSQWLCERHNAVNEKLGKSTFECGKVDERWKDGPADGSCD
ncbi:ERV/ALR sulfhydryl oxidase domain-containing protein, partial [Cyathus striatus]